MKIRGDFSAGVLTGGRAGCSAASASSRRRLQGVATEVTRWIPLLLLTLTLSASAQPFTNSATLSAAVDGTNLVINYSLTTTQGWVTLFSADRPEQFPASAQPVDLAPAPPGLTGQFRVPIAPGAPTKFYKLLIEQWVTRGRANVFIGGPLDFAAMRQTYGDIINNNQINSTNGPTNTTPMIFKPQVDVWVDNLGTFDWETGVRTGPPGVYDTNGIFRYYLYGKYAYTSISSIDSPSLGYPLVDRHASTSGDFRVTCFGAIPFSTNRYFYSGDSNIPIREAVIWSSENQLYYDINEYRKRFLNDAFIDELGLPPQLAANFKYRQYRPDLQMPNPLIPGKPSLSVYEDLIATGLQFFPEANLMLTSIRTRGPYHGFDLLPPMSFAYDSGVCVGDYAGMAAFWILGTNTGFPTDAYWGESPNWPTKTLSPINNGLSQWVAYRYQGNPEVYRYNQYAHRIWDGRPCGGTFIPCDKGENLRNVMMFDEANLSKDGVYPFDAPFSGQDGPNGKELGAMYVTAILYDMANEAGLGLHKTDLLIWKTISLITSPPDNFTMRQFGGKIQEAARALWPDLRPGRTGLSLYEEDIVDALTSRGIPMNGVSDFRTNLPPAIGSFPATLEVSSASGFGSSHPESHPSVGFYGNYSLFQNRYTDTNTSAAYVAYQFYKHSKYGPCDKLALTDGTFTTTNVAPFNWSYNSNGTFYTELTDRDLGNCVVLLPGHSVRWMRSRQRCPNEATGFYAEDVRPFGFRVIKATPNGFSFTASALSETATNKTYQLVAVDPSSTALGLGTYAWTFTDYLGNSNTVTGASVQYTALKDQPFTLTIARTRASQTDTLTLRERGNDLDRNGGQAFVRNLVP